MNLSFEKLTSFTLSNQLSGVFERCRALKTLSKGFPDQHSVRGMGPIDSSMDVVEQTNALGLSDTLEKNPISPSFVEGTVYHLIAHGFMAGSFYVRIINQSSLVCEVRLDWILQFSPFPCRAAA